MEVKIIGNDKKVKFDDLLIGDVYWDRDGILCIKTFASECIYYSEETNSWDISSEEIDEFVEPAKATLTIE